jgi:3-dehydroquinate synthase
VLAAFGLPVTLLDVDRDGLMTAMLRDKKVEHGRLRFVLPSKLGSVELVGDVDERDIRAALAV